MEQEIVAELISSRADLQQCGPAVIHLLDTTYELFQQNSYSRAIILAHNLLELSKEKVLAHYQALPVCFLRLYADSTIMKVLGVFFDDGIISGKQEGAEKWMECIRDLDMVLIVAGGAGRREIIFKLIKSAQDHLPLPSHSIASKVTSTPSAEPATKRRKLPSNYPSISNPIPRISQLPDFESLPNLLKSPFIVTGGCADWPAINKWKDLNYVKELAGVGRVVPVEIGTSYVDSDWTQKIILLADFLDSLTSSSNNYYLAQYDLFAQLPALLDDIIIPDIVYSAPEGTNTYKPPDDYIINSWISLSNSLSPAHTDPYYNSYAQVVGRKWIWVAPPEVGNSMSAFGQDAGEEDSGATNYMMNTSRVPISTLPSTLEGISPVIQNKYSKFFENVLPVAQSEILEAGDMLVMPPGWWHSMKSDEFSFSVSLWF